MLADAMGSLNVQDAVFNVQMNCWCGKYSGCLDAGNCAYRFAMLTVCAMVS